MTKHQGTHTQMVRLFLVFTYIWQKDVPKIPEVQRAPRDLNPAQAMTMVSKRNHLFTIHLHLASFYATKYF